MLRSILRRDPPLERLVQVYFSGTRFIVAATHRNGAGIYYEQPSPVVVDNAQPADVGAAFQSAFDACSVRERDLSGWKKSDWPAYRASGLPSVRAFERAYTAIQCQGLNTANATVRASCVYPADREMELSIAFNPRLDAGEVGGMLIRLAHAARRV